MKQRCPPNGKLSVSFDITEDYCLDWDVYSVDETGKPTRLDSVIGQAKRTVPTELEHFRTHVWVGNRPNFVDIHLDNAINASDTPLALQHSVNLIMLQDAEAKSADATLDGSINANDALKILPFSVGLTHQF